MVEDPERIVALVDRWLKEGWCKRLVVNLKFGRTDPIALLRRAEVLRRHCPGLKARHLFHDREEFTLVGESRARS
jgi:23S rRNA (cytidine2498-2'-O)-methyltransferase